MIDKFLTICFLLSLTTFLFTSCAKDETMDPTDTCESTDLTYSNFAGEFINSNCGNAGCHAAGSAFTFEMHNYETTKTAVDLGRIIGAINHEEGFSAMPQGQSQLSECNIEKLTTWIQDGAPE